VGVDAIVTAAAGVLTGVDGIAQAFTDAPEALAQFPCVVIIAEKGEIVWPRRPNLRDTTHDLRMLFLVSRGGDLAGADKTLKPWIDQVVAAFDAAVTLGGACLAAGVVSYEYGKVEYAGVEYLGITFTLRAREIQGVVYAG